VRYREMAGCLMPRKVDAKLANLLPILARKFGDEEEGRLVIRLRLTQEELAKMISTTRESVTCALADLRRRGVLAVVGGRIVILDPDGLANTGRWEVRGMLAEAEVHPSKKKGREVLRYFDEGYVARVNAYREPSPTRRPCGSGGCGCRAPVCRGQRLARAEAVRAQGTGEEGQRAEALWIAAAQNVRRLVAVLGSGDRNLGHGLAPPCAHPPGRHAAPATTLSAQTRSATRLSPEPSDAVSGYPNGVART
jgi:hypothetical protein